MGAPEQLSHLARRVPDKPPRAVIAGALLAAVVLGVALLSARLPGGKPPPPPPEASFVEGPPLLRWVLRGSQLLVNGKWLLNPATGRFSALPYATARALPGGGLESLGTSFSWDGAKVVVWDARGFSFGPVDSALTGPLALPLLNPRLDEEAEELMAVEQVLFWASEHQLLLYQFEQTGDAEPLCGVFDTRKREWRPVASCPWGDFRALSSIEPGPDGWIAVHSYAEGSEAFLLARYDLEKGQRETRAPRRSLYPMGVVQVHFSLDGTRIDLSTNCRLEDEERPCEAREDEEEERWRLYSWRVREERLDLVREGLPHRVVPASESTRQAWLLSDRVCLGGIAAREHEKCFCLPRLNAPPCLPE